MKKKPVEAYISEKYFDCRFMKRMLNSKGEGWQVTGATENPVRPRSREALVNIASWESPYIESRSLYWDGSLVALTQPHSEAYDVDDDAGHTQVVHPVVGCLYTRNETGRHYIHNVLIKALNMLRVHGGFLKYCL